MPFPAIPTQVKCPKCGQSFITQMWSIIDLGEQPELKEQFLKGEINYAKCPDCGSGGLMSIPMLYHDPQKELLAVFVPSGLGLPADQQEQLVGNLVNTVMNSLPAEERKSYFLQPKIVLTIDSLYDAILEADGVSKEYLDAQRARLRLIHQLLALVQDDQGLDELVEEHRKELDYEFFLTLSEMIEGYKSNDDEEGAQALESLRGKLLERVEPAGPAAAPADATYDDVIELLRNTNEGDAWRRAIALNRPRLDYGFFQALTAKIDAAEDSESAGAFKELRRRILDEIDRQNRMAREAQDKASLLIMTLSEAQDVEAAVREHIDEIDEVFIAVLVRYREAARSQSDTARADKLEAILQAVTDVLEEGLAPDVRLINRLLRAEHPEGTNEVLEAHRGLLNDALLKTYDDFLADVEKRGDAQAVEHLKKTRQQIVAKITILRA